MVMVMNVKLIVIWFQWTERRWDSETMSCDKKRGNNCIELNGIRLTIIFTMKPSEPPELRCGFCVCWAAQNLNRWKRVVWFDWMIYRFLNFFFFQFCSKAKMNCPQLELHLRLLATSFEFLSQKSIWQKFNIRSNVPKDSSPYRTPFIYRYTRNTRPFIPFFYLFNRLILGGANAALNFVSVFPSSSLINEVVRSGRHIAHCCITHLMPSDATQLKWLWLTGPFICSFSALRWLLLSYYSCTAFICM